MAESIFWFMLTRLWYHNPQARKTILYSELFVHPLATAALPALPKADCHSSSACSVMEVITQIGSRFKVEPAEIKKVRSRLLRTARALRPA